MSGCNVKMKEVITGIIVSVIVTTFFLNSQAWSETVKKQNHAFYISVETLNYMIAKDNAAVIVDIRKSKDFNVLRIPGSENIPLYAIKTRNYLKTKKVVLVNEGFRRSLPEKECEKLKKLGFRVQILSGGLAAWKAKGQALEGDPFKAKRLNRISSYDFALEMEAQNTILVDISKEPSAVFKQLSHFKHFPVSDSKAGAERLGKHIGAMISKIPLSVVITNETGEKYDRIEKVLSSSGNRMVFYLDGGNNGYLGFLKNHNSMNMDRKKRLVKQQGCSTCGDE